jgi:hypothetical protein
MAEAVGTRLEACQSIRDQPELFDRPGVAALTQPLVHQGVHSREPADGGLIERDRTTLAQALHKAIQAASLGLEVVTELQQPALVEFRVP